VTILRHAPQVSRDRWDDLHGLQRGRAGRLQARNVGSEIRGPLLGGTLLGFAAALTRSFRHTCALALAATLYAALFSCLQRILGTWM
jgi:hypothetical protein